MYILYENGERIILIKTLIPKMHLNMSLLDLCVSAKMGHCGCKKRSSLCTAAPLLKKIGKSDIFEGRGGCTQARNGPGLSHKRPLFYIKDRMNI